MLLHAAPFGARCSLGSRFRGLLGYRVLPKNELFASFEVEFRGTEDFRL